MAIKHALVVDDSRSARHMLRTMLEKNDLSVDQCESGQEAIEYLSHKRPDIIFMDHMMPGMDGLQATKIITNNPETNAIPIIMYTSKDDPEYADEAKAHGAVGILPKPANWPLLNDLLQQITARKAAGSKPSVAASPVAASINNVVPFMLSEERISQIEAQVLVRVKELLGESSNSLTARCIEMLDLATNRTNAMIGTQEQEIRALVNSMLGEFQARSVNDVRDQIKTELSGLVAKQFAEFKAQVDESMQLQLKDAVKQALFVYEAQDKAVTPAKEVNLDELRASLSGDINNQVETSVRRITKNEMQINLDQIKKDTSIKLTTETLAKQREAIAAAQKYALLAALAGIGTALLLHFM